MQTREIWVIFEWDGAAWRGREIARTETAEETEARLRETNTPAQRRAFAMVQREWVASLEGFYEQTDAEALATLELAFPD